MADFNAVLAAVNAILWHDWVLFVVLGTGVVFTIWSRFCQYRALTHGVRVIRGSYDDPSDPGAINHFQALSAALSATVGLGNIGGVALAITLGGPGAVFWMWVVGLFGMSLKLTEVGLSMLYRNTDDPDNPHGGPMWVVSKGLARLNPQLASTGRTIGAIFCMTLLVSTATGGNMFQAWNVGEITSEYFGIPQVVCGIVLAVLVGMVIIGGIKRIGAVAGRLVPLMVALYLLAGFYVLVVSADRIPEIFALIFRAAFSPLEGPGIYATYVGATLTAKAFDSVTPGLGKWLVTLAAWLFAVSTMISWSYYGEQGVVYLFGDRGVLPYKFVFCALILVATWGFIETSTELDNLTSLGTGVMLLANIPIMWLFGAQAMRAYHDYMTRLKEGRMGPEHPPPSLEDLISGRDVR